MQLCSRFSDYKCNNNNKKHKCLADYDQTPSASTINITKNNDEEELTEVTENEKSITEKKVGCEVTFSPVKTRKQKRESVFLLPDNITPISRSGCKIIDSSMLWGLISASRCSFCKNETLQVRQNNKKGKGMC